MTTAQLTEESTSRYVDVNGFRVHYNEAGEGPVLVMLHGGGPGATGWSNFAPKNLVALAAHHRVLLVDQPGFGLSDMPPEDMPRGQFFVKVMLGMLDGLGIDKVSFVGNSMGSGNALAFTIAHEARVDKLVLIGGVGGPPLIGHEPTEGTKILDAAYANPSLESFRRFFDMMLYDPSTISDQVLQARVDAALQRRHQLEARVAANRRFAGARRDNSEAASKLQVPVLIFHGRNDRVGSLESALRAVSVIPNSRLVVFNHCGHWVQYERGEEFNRTLLDFLANA